MCGLVGLHLRNAELHPQLGELLGPPLDCRAARGSEPASIALYDDAAGPDELRVSVRSEEPVNWGKLASRLSAELQAGVAVESYATAAVLTAAAEEDRVVSGLRGLAPKVVLVGSGRAVEVHKHVGVSIEFSRHYGVAKWSTCPDRSSTRMPPVESDVGPSVAPTADVSLVHTGVFSNYRTLRWRLEKKGIQFATGNDSEVAARYIADQLAHGADLAEALRMVLTELDGFITLLAATRTEFALVRNSSCARKPAAIAETSDYVAVTSEHHPLPDLPDISEAQTLEPLPGKIYVWRR